MIFLAGSAVLSMGVSAYVHLSRGGWGDFWWVAGILWLPLVIEAVLTLWLGGRAS